MEEQIELALNKGDNGKNLYQHIQYVNTTIHLYDPDSIQETVEFQPSTLTPQLTAWEKAYSESFDKKNVMAFMSHYSDCDFDELEYRDGEWYNADGENAWTLAKTSFLESVPTEEKLAAIMALLGMSSAYQNLVQSGFDNVDDRNMTITYSGGALYDYGSAQGIGEGQTDWIDEVRDEIEKNIEVFAEYNALVDARMAELEANKVKPVLYDFDPSEGDERFLALLKEKYGEFPEIAGLNGNTIEELLAQINDKYASYQSLLDTLLGNDD